MRAWLLLAVGLTGCADAVWTPAVGLPWWEEEGLVPAERVAEGCTLQFEEVVLGLPVVGLRDGASWTAPPNQAVDLVVGMRTLGEVRVPEGGDYTDVALTLGPVEEVADTAADGGATAEQRARVTAGGVARLGVSCGDEVGAIDLQLPASTVICPFPASVEIRAQGSFGTLAVFDAAALLGPELFGPELLAEPPVIESLDGAWTNQEGTRCVVE